MSRAPHFEVVHTDAGWHARFVAANGQTVWTTESYTRRRAADRAIEMFTGNRVTWTRFSGGHETFHEGTATLLEVRLVDERAPRCQFVSPSPWGPTQCALPDGHQERHAYSPSEALS